MNDKSKWKANVEKHKLLTVFVYKRQQKIEDIIFVHSIYEALLKGISATKSLVSTNFRS